MAEVKGKLIMLAADLLRSRPAVRSSAIGAIKRMTGKAPFGLEPEGWYDTAVLNGLFRAIDEGESPLVAWAVVKVIGQNLYPAIYGMGLPKHLRSPMDFLKLEAEDFLKNHRGIDVVPRKFIKAEDHYIIIEALSPGYNCALTEGVFGGILRMCHATRSKVKQTKCVRKGDSTCEYHIQW